MREHEARSRTRGDRLGVTDTPVCERFHGQRLWSPYKVIVHIVSGLHGNFRQMMILCIRKDGSMRGKLYPLDSDFVPLVTI
jgi:hypothetical protein